MPAARQPSRLVACLATLYLAALIWLIGIVAGSAAAEALAAGLSNSGSNPVAANDPRLIIALALVSQGLFVLGCLGVILLLPTTFQANHPRRNPPPTPDSPPRFTLRDEVITNLRLHRPRMPLWLWPVLLGSNLFVWAGTSILFAQLFTEPGEHLEGLADTIQAVQTPLTIALTVLAVGILPGLGEEALTRGFLLGRLKKLLPAWLAITLTSVLFAAMHLNPQQAILIFPLGLWWTIISWRTGSVWPAVALHAFNNTFTLCWSWFLYDRMEHVSEPAQFGMLGLAGLCFVTVLAMLFTHRLGPPADQPLPSPTPHQPSRSESP